MGTAAGTVLPVPSAISPLQEYTTWYPGQDRAFSAIMDWMASDSRWLCVEAPTGTGKSLLAMLSATVSRRRTAIITATKGLQDQLGRDFGEHLRDIRGQNSYLCRRLGDGSTVEHAPCHAGVPCAHRDYPSTCDYYGALERTSSATVAVTNYAYWMAQHAHSAGIGDRELLILDEAHLIFSALESHVSVRLAPHEVGVAGGDWPTQDFKSWAGWRGWAHRNAATAGYQADKLKLAAQADQGPAVMRAYSRMQSLNARLKTIAASHGEWAWERTTRGLAFSPIWPEEYAASLYLDVPKILLMSAFMTPKVADMIGVPADRSWVAVQSTYPAANTPVRHVKTAAINRHSTDAHMGIWAARIDQLIDRRLDRKGVVFTVSYSRRDYLMSHSKHSDIMVSHGTDNVVEMVEKFKRSKPPAVLVSPSVTSGWDFPGDTCEYIIIGKIPYPDTRPAVVRARHDQDRDWTAFSAMMTLVQSAGRGTRGPGERCEVWVVDDTWRWWWPANKRFAPTWFAERVAMESSDYVEGPPW
jgi:ATP-dependent DNA helicase DinG